MFLLKKLSKPTGVKVLLGTVIMSWVIAGAALWLASHRKARIAEMKTEKELALEISQENDRVVAEIEQAYVKTINQLKDSLESCHSRVAYYRNQKKRMDDWKNEQLQARLDQSTDDCVHRLIPEQLQPFQTQDSGRLQD